MIAAPLKMIGGQAQRFEPFHEIRSEHLTLSIECIPAQPCTFAPREREGADVIQLLAQLALIDQIRQGDRGRAIDQAKGHLRVRPIAKHRLAHQEFVKIGIN